MGHRETEFIRATRSWIGAPFRHGGRDRGGCDCVGLVIGAAKETGLIPEDYDFRDYDEMPTERMAQVLRAEFGRFMAFTPAAGQRAWMDGSVLLLDVAGLPVHCAVYSAQGGTIIHALSTVDRVVEHHFRGVWAERLHGGFYWKREA